ncbi:MAG: hypothetical protein ACYTDY_19050 [Planctomycetota bacterium]|jgi:hypothetical protein
MPESTSTRTPTTLLVVILLAVLVEPLLIAMILSGEDDPGEVRQDPRLAGAIEDLCALLRERPEARRPAGATENSSTAAPEAVLERIARALERAGPAMPSMPTPTDVPDVEVPAGEEAPRESFPELTSVQERVDAVIRQELERTSQRKSLDNTRFLLSSVHEILEKFGSPTTSHVYNGWVRWYYRGVDKRQFYVDIMDGRVWRFGF